MLPNPCSRGCCWTPFGCAHGRSCWCHHGEQRSEPADPGEHATYRDPTAIQAIRNITQNNNRR